jgi:hypothetical protein
MSTTTTVAATTAATTVAAATAAMESASRATVVPAATRTPWRRIRPWRGTVRARCRIASIAVVRRWAVRTSAVVRCRWPICGVVLARAGVAATRPRRTVRGHAARTAHGAVRPIGTEPLWRTARICRAALCAPGACGIVRARSAARARLRRVRRTAARQFRLPAGAQTARSAHRMCIGRARAARGIHRRIHGVNRRVRSTCRWCAACHHAAILDISRRSSHVRAHIRCPECAGVRR